MSVDWNAVKEALSIIGDICLFLITAYTFYLTIYPKKLKFTSFSSSFSAFDGDYFTVVLENRSLSPVTINKVDLVFDDKYHVTIYDDDKDSDACVVEPFKTQKVKMLPYSEIRTADGSQINVNTGNIYLVVSTARRDQYLSYVNRPKQRFLRRKAQHNKELQNTMVVRNYFNDLIVKRGVKYAITYFDKKHDRHTVFIAESGAMSAAPFGYNGLPKELVADQEKLLNHFKAEFEKYNIPFSLDEITPPLPWSEY